MARPPTDMLKGDNGKVSTNQSRRVRINLNQSQQQAFEKLKNVLASKDVLLIYPNFNRPFDLTTDASAHGDK